MKFKDNLPIYLQISNLIKKRIAAGELREGEKLTSVREFSTKLKTNPNTVQRAYSELENEDLVYTKRGMGTFVTEDKETLIRLKKTMAEEIVRTFISNMNAIGFEKEEIIDIIDKKMEEV